ncbi:chemotaxis protein CheA [Pelagicoccus sp. SDUM812005]|uniref:chemotaxis protein CheA n=1 Tax=Pelagicoccus sp. SDUM812005 TaxID=3041257 RepID=UPI00280FC2BD|nr:chemotaxis protein CheA [Pelagicoccus sp. SDUM812005]MDQ8180916.1 chemotaxis protein CheA [Pelagicoccus sp. SDUM812005]
MAWSPDEINSFEEIAAKLASESHLAQPGTDDGLIPIFSLVNEITWSLPQDPEIVQGVVGVQEVIQAMLDEAKLFDETSVHAMRAFARWCSDAVESLRNDTPIRPFSIENSKETPVAPAAIPIDDEPEAETSEPEPMLEIPADDSAELPEPTPLPSFGDIDFSTAEPPAPKPAAPAPELEEEPFSFDAPSFEAAEEPTFDAPTAGNENWPEERIEIFAKLAQQFSAELLLSSVDSDEGMLPVYSLLKDFENDFETDETVHAAVTPVLAKMDALLDNAAAYDPFAIQILTDFNVWLETALSEIKSGREPGPFSPPEEAAPVEADSSQLTTGEEEDDGLLAEFAQYDVVMDLNMEENEELLQEFHTEAVDHLSQIESAVLELEQDVTSRNAINSMFRSFHTIKGVAGFLNLVPVNRLAHEVESLMDLVRNDKLEVFTGIIDLVLAAKDTITKLIEQITEALANGTTPNEVIPVSELMARARWAMEGPDVWAQKTGEDSNTMAVAADEPELPAATEDFSDEDQSPAAPAAAAKASAPAATPVAQQEPDAKAAAAAKRKAAENATIRVNTTKLDNLMDMVGELVIVQSQLLESSRQDNGSGSTAGDSALQRNMSQLTRITKELQHTSMALRMIPVKPTFQKMGRIVRDIGAKCGKKVRFETFGEDTELDRNVVEEIGDPLVHMVRNALDHGLEADAEERRAAGKDEVGNISLKAYHQGSNIVIELADDGRGIDPDRVLAKAIANGIVSESDQLSKEEIYKLIFAPGFSTAAQITDISGRGVGMDVVKKNIEKLRGKVEIQSELGKGSTFRILLPLTMAIVDGLVVKVGEDRFILPTTSVKVALRPDEAVLAKVQGNQEILNIRGQVIPLFRLHQHFAIPGAISNPKDATVVVVETGGKPCGLLVDDMVSKQEVVIKSLGGMMQGIPGVSGGAILGDGTIALILDPASLISAA